ncbi:MAG: hypothetical protein DMG25_11940 [Acidobacteria bacterium]|nr:MAG: hypothetical protein DMG25_11940 [Acidobacteriota bacterium]PYV28113.1 MAG: hypothetical protein DMG27_02155 [Acidobacteriota bacterium]
MAAKRHGVFVWITWLARVMAGEQNCEWATWFKAHHENYDKAPSDFDTAKWNIEHTRQLRRLRLERRKLGERVFLQGGEPHSPDAALGSGHRRETRPHYVALRSGRRRQA